MAQSKSAEGNLGAIEVRKRRAQWSRISLSWAIVGTFIFLVWL